MDRRTFVKLAAAAAIASTISGCTSANDETGANQMPMEDGLTSGGPMSCITFGTGEITDIDEDALATTSNQSPSRVWRCPAAEALKTRRSMH